MANEPVFGSVFWNCYKAPMILEQSEPAVRMRPSHGVVPRVRSTLDFTSLHDHARMPARFFGRLFAAGAAGLLSL